jgi:hypothetical protein
MGRGRDPGRALASFVEESVKPLLRVFVTAVSIVRELHQAIKVADTDRHLQGAKTAIEERCSIVLRIRGKDNNGAHF